MARFGLNPWGEPLYRIVFAPSVRQLAVLRDNPRYVKKYPGLGNQWLMEAWQMPTESKANWDRVCSVLGPYPSRGFYDHCHTFEACSPTDANIEKLVEWIQMSRKTSFQDVRDACQGEYDREKENTRRMARDQIEDALPAFLDAPLSARGGNRGSKTRDFKFSDFKNLPRPGSFKVGKSAIPGRPQYAQH